MVESETKKKKNNTNGTLSSERKNPKPITMKLARRRGGFGGKEKKHLQLFIPTFLAFNAVGWMMLAVKAVALLVVKAIVVSKLALIVTLFFITRKVLSSVNEKYVNYNIIVTE